MAKTTYKSSGVDIEAGSLFVELIKPLAKSTAGSNVLGKIGGFSGAYELPAGKYKKPVLVAATDGVGTKLRIAFKTGRLDTIGIDLVAMNVNDIVACGAEPLFFLDYLATSRLKPEEAVEIIKGVVRGCKSAGCALLGGETAEMPGFYRDDEFDLAGFAVGIVEKDEIIDGSRVSAGDAVIGLQSSGLHSNGYSLARKVLLEKRRYKPGDKPAPLRRPLGDELLEPTRIYVKTVLGLKRDFAIHAVAHITGGGLLDNIPRVLPKGCSAYLDSSKWDMPPVMELIEKDGRIGREEMLRTFNCGVGMILIVPQESARAVLKKLGKMKEKASVIGEIRKRKPRESVVVVV